MICEAEKQLRSPVRPWRQHKVAMVQDKIDYFYKRKSNATTVDVSEAEPLALALIEPVQVEREIAAQYSYDDIIADFKGRKYRRATL